MAMTKQQKDAGFRARHRDELLAYERSPKRVERRRLWNVANRAKIAAAAARFAAMYPETKAARVALRNALRRGEVVKPPACEKCGTPGYVEGSHNDYSRPLEVEWLCRSCHRAKDRARPLTRELLATALAAAEREVAELRARAEQDRDLKQRYYNEASDGWSKFRQVEARVAALEADRNAIAEKAMATRGRLTKLEAIGAEILLYFTSGNDVPVERATIQANSSAIVKLRDALKMDNHE
jgi:hypothetical protein